MSSRMRRLAALPVVALLAALAAPTPAGEPGKARTYTFCFWNVENFFDDRSDADRDGVDRTFDDYFAKDKEALEKKLERLTDVLLSKELNDGKGPDILAVAEIESQRTAELIKDALNARIKDKKQHYTGVVYRDPKGLRHIATAVISRVTAVGTGRLIGSKQRILEVKLVENKHELTVIASHWTSRVSDKAGKGRSGYASRIYDDFFAAYRKNPNVDYLVCGDFNDTPTDDAVENDLGAFGDVNKALSLKKGDKPVFFNPFAALAKAGKGTHSHNDRPFLFDQVCVSPGLLDGDGWQYVNKSAAIVEKFTFRGRPDRFGGPDDRRPWRSRGASDHFPVTVQLRVGK